MATDPHSCGSVAFLHDGRDKTALHRCCVRPVRNSHRTCRSCFVSRVSCLCVAAAVGHGLYTVSFTGAGGAGGTVWRYNGPEASSEGDL